MFKLFENLSVKMKMNEIMASFIVLFLVIGAVVLYSVYDLGKALDRAYTQSVPATASVRTFKADNDRINLLINYAVAEIDDPVKVKTLLLEINKNKVDFQEQFRVLEGIAFGGSKVVIENMAPDVKEFVFEVEQADDFLSWGQKAEAEAAVDYLNDTSVKLKKNIEDYKSLVTQHAKQNQLESVKLRNWVIWVVILIMVIGLGLGLLGLFILVRQRDKEIKRQHEELLHVTRVGKLAEFVSSFAHEINQPLTAILTYAQAAKRILGKREPQIREIFQHIIDDDQRAAAVIKHIRSLIKKNASEMKPVDINTLVKDTVALITTDLHVTNDVLKTEMDSNLPPIKGDPVQLQQVLLNLISNSFDAMKNNEGSHNVLIRTLRKDLETIIVEVKDSGCGIPSKIMPQLFEHFFTSKPDGLGMGLSISRSIIEAHGGHLEGKNNLDRGATFFFTIPASA